MDETKINEPCYVISIAAKLVSVHPQTLRYYERLGLVQPSRSLGRIRLYSDRDIERLKYVKRLIDDLGVNLAGVEVIINMLERMAQMEHDLDELQRQLEARAEGAGTNVIGRMRRRRIAVERTGEGDRK